ncbi:MAG: hypothetical protein N5P05_003534 [Chroococcopsis gigantea SAG 12.99]|jgi:hypothetical protein|nr:LysM peptidoglycan-binding domain-containing protein [Chlorogloea purpurea SAG 13.99]MDV3001928.1 hypothetical protein [Chroococcopsis gigantea SAG 12.99]
MTVKITCPVCDKPNIESDTCPNCEADLGAIKMLMELTSITPKTASNETPSRFWLSGLALLLLLAGIGLGVIAASNFAQKSVPVSQSNITAPVVIQGVAPPESAGEKNKPCAVGFYYRVREGDSLSVIADRFYDNISDYSFIVTANPSLKSRPDKLEIGEKILIPNQEESDCE